MHLGTDATDALEEMHILDVAALLTETFYASVHVANAHGSLDDALAGCLQHQRERLLQQRMLRANGDGDPAHRTSSLDSNGGGASQSSGNSKGPRPGWPANSIPRSS